MVLAGSGFVLKYDPDAAKKLVDAHRSRKKGGRNTRNARRATDSQQETDDSDQAPPPPDNTQRTAAEVVAGANRATSVGKERQVPGQQTTQPRKSEATTADNYYDSMASDSDDERGFLDRDLEGKNNQSSNFYPVASARRCHVSKSLSSLAHRELHQMKLALRQEDEAECCAPLFPTTNASTRR